MKKTIMKTSLVKFGKETANIKYSGKVRMDPKNIFIVHI